jgi:hypothetical protein
MPNLQRKPNTRLTCHQPAAQALQRQLPSLHGQVSRRHRLIRLCRPERRIGWACAGFMTRPSGEPGNGVAARRVSTGVGGETVPPLSEQLGAQFERARASRTPELVATLESVIGALRESHFVEGALKVDDRAPGFSLPNVRAETIRLGDLLGRGAVVLSFYRGGW